MTKDTLPSPVSVPAAVIRAVVCAHEQFASVADYAALTVECARCSGAGYHHGFGELGHDPDWCTECGGVGSALNEAAYDAAEIAFITQSLAQAPFPVSVPEGDAREIAREIADLACGPFPTGGPAAKHREKIADRITAALLSAEGRGERKMREGAAQCVEAFDPHEIARLRARVAEMEGEVERLTMERDDALFMRATLAAPCQIDGCQYSKLLVRDT